jgi:hypothetical protein
MPVDLKDIASIAGMSGLYRVVSPSRNGIVVETLDDKNNRFVAQAKHRISLLSEISIYQNNTEETLPLAEVFDRIRQQNGNEVPVTPKSSSAELTQFMETIVPDYDRERVYISDIKKIAGWYAIVSKYVSFTESAAPETPTEPEPATVEAETAAASEKTEKSS